jgi:PEP-CTERM/exosortase A-associated glycosyltransferase
MRVLHVLDHSIPLHSGYTFRTLSIVREQRALGWETYHLTSPKHALPAPDEEEIDGLHFFRTPQSPTRAINAPVLRELSLMAQLRRRMDTVIQQVRPELIHVHSPVLNAIPALRLGARYRIPVVYEVRAFWEDAAVDHGTASEWGLRYRLTRYLETYALKRAAHVTTICEGLKSDMLGRGIEAERITVVPNGVDVSAFHFRSARDEALREQFGLKGCTVVGFVGSFYAYEGLDLLIEALPQVLAAHGDVRVLLVGGGPQEQQLKSRVKDRGLETKVIFAGRVPHEDVQRYYSLMDVMAYPRHSMRLTELVTPLKPLEAMAQGHIVLASSVGGHRELIRHGETGVLFEPGNPAALARGICNLIERSHDWPRMRQLGRDFVEHERTWQRSVARYRPVFERLVGNPR